MPTITGGNPNTLITTMDEIGPGGAHHIYEVAGPDGVVFARPVFQCGPVTEAGYNGVFDEDLVAILIHRLKCFQASEFSCEENVQSLRWLQAAALWMRLRQGDQVAKGIEGENEQ